MLRASLVMLIVLGSWACGGDDGGTPIDAGQDAPDPDADALCGTTFRYEAEVSDWFIGLGISPVSATEVGNESNRVMTAPNGRMVICLDLAATTDILYHCESGSGCTPASGVGQELYFDRIDVLEPAAAQTYAALSFFKSPMLRLADAAAVASAQNIPTDTGHVLVEIVDAQTGAAIIGATATLTADMVLGSYTPDDSGDYVTGNVLTHDSQVLFIGVAHIGRAAVTATAPGKTCTGPASVPVVESTISHALFTCE
jgi:hypothetical protein